MQASATPEKLEVGAAKGLTSKSRGGLPPHGSPSLIASQPPKFFANDARSAIVISSSLGSLPLHSLPSPRPSYQPDLQDAAVQTLLQQAESLSAAWATWSWRMT